MPPSPPSEPESAIEALILTCEHTVEGFLGGPARIAAARAEHAALLRVAEAAGRWNVAERVGARTDGLHLSGPKFDEWNASYKALLEALSAWRRCAMGSEPKPSLADAVRAVPLAYDGPPNKSGMLVAINAPSDALDAAIRAAPELPAPTLEAETVEQAFEILSQVAAWDCLKAGNEQAGGLPCELRWPDKLQRWCPVCRASAFMNASAPAQRGASTDVP